MCIYNEYVEYAFIFYILTFMCMYVFSRREMDTEMESIQKYRLDRGS